MVAVPAEFVRTALRLLDRYVAIRSRAHEIDVG